MMMHNRKWMVGSLLLSLIVLVAFVALVPLTAANSPQGDLWAYMPFVAAQPRPPLGINGRVTENGVPAPGIPIELRFYNGSSWSTAASLSTDANAEYHFLNMPGLAAGQIYYARYVNPENNSNRIGAWYGFIHHSYATGADAIGGDIDIGPLNLANPGSGAVVGFPTTFTWNPRPITTDSYQFDLFAESNNPYFYTNPPLGYVNNYTLQGLPAGFDYYTWYLWSLVAFGPGGNPDAGNYGFSYWARWVGWIETAASPEMVTPPNALVRNPLPADPEIAR
jgi:hypothetical protein